MLVLTQGVENNDIISNFGLTSSFILTLLSLLTFLPWSYFASHVRALHWNILVVCRSVQLCVVLILFLKVSPTAAANPVKSGLVV